MSDRAQRVLDALMKFDATNEYDYPLEALHDFVTNISSFKIIGDYEALTVDEEKQIIKAFLEFAY